MTFFNTPIYKVLFVLFILQTTTTCKNNVNKKSITTKSEQYSNIDFLKISNCCNTYSFEKGDSFPMFHHNSKNLDALVYFLPKNTKTVIRWKNEDRFDEDGIYNENKLKNELEKNIHEYNVIALFCPSKDLLPIYENNEEASYFDYKFPVHINIYMLNSNNSWHLIEENKIFSEDDFYSFKEKQSIINYFEAIKNKPKNK